MGVRGGGEGTQHLFDTVSDSQERSCDSAVLRCRPSNGSSACSWNHPWAYCDGAFDWQDLYFVEHEVGIEVILNCEVLPSFASNQGATSRVSSLHPSLAGWKRKNGLLRSLKPYWRPSVGIVCPLSEGGGVDPRTFLFLPKLVNYFPPCLFSFSVSTHTSSLPSLSPF